MNTSPGNSPKTTVMVIAGAMIMGVVMFALIVLVIKGLSAPRFTLFAGISLIMSISSLVMALVLPHLILSKATGLDEATAIARFQTATIVRFALLEGGGFVALVFSLIEPNAFTWLLGLLAVVAMILLFPFPWRCDDAVEEMTSGR